jgi:hypothetical protein
MSGERWFQDYRDAWSRFYGFENMKAILQRAPDRNYFNIMKNFIWYKNALIEGEHPMITGFFRKKRRLDRRPGLAVESRWVYLRRRTREISHITVEWLRLYWEMQELWLATWPQRDHRVQLARRHVVRWRDIGRSTLHPMRWPAVLPQIVMRFALVGRQRLIIRSEAALQALERRRARLSRRMLNLHWSQTLQRFRTLRWHKIDVFETLANAYREVKIDLWFLAHIMRSRHFDAVGRLG